MTQKNLLITIQVFCVQNVKQRNVSYKKTNNKQNIGSISPQKMPKLFYSKIDSNYFLECERYFVDEYAHKETIINGEANGKIIQNF